MTSAKRERIRQLIPHNFVVFEKTMHLENTEIKIKSTEWGIITQIDGNKSMGEIADALSLTEDESLAYFYNLHEKGLIRIKDLGRPEKSFAPPDFFDYLNQELVNTIGPVAGFVIDDVLWELNAGREKFLKDNIPLLIETVSQEISDEEKKVHFQQRMLEHLKKL